MAIKVFEADSDYINVGKIMLPRDASDYGYADYDTITKDTQKKYDDEKEAERQEAERQAFAKTQADIFPKVEAILNDDTIDPSKKIEDLFDVVVPATDKADSIGGELVRAVNRVGYRFMNDGDHYFEGYGLETCGSDAAYIAETSNDEIYNYIVDFAERINGMLYDDRQINEEYKPFLNGLYAKVVEYLRDNMDACFNTRNTVDSRSYESNLVNEWETESHNYEYDASDVFYSLPSEWDALLDAGIVSENDVYDLCDNLTYSGFPGSAEQPYRDSIIIVNLDREGYEYWNDNFWREFDAWLDDLIDENRDYLDSLE